MLRELNKNELAMVSGGGLSTDITDVYPAVIPGYVLVGWSEQIVGWDIYTWTEGYFYPIVHEEKNPIIEILPLYSPVVYY